MDLALQCVGFELAWWSAEWKIEINNVFDLRLDTSIALLFYNYTAE
jgi:hypothetical protein